MMDIKGEIRRIKNKDAAETFNPATDSLEAVRDWLVGGGAGSPGLCYYGVITNVVSATQFDADLLAGHGNSFFNGFRIYVVRDQAGGGILPQGTGRACTAYVSATGRFTSTAFIAPLTVGDEILLIHPALTGKLVATGILTASSTVQPVDNLRPEADQWFRGCTLQMLSGPCADQTRAIVYYQNPGIFTLDTANPLTALPVVGSAYVVWGSDFPVCPGADSGPTLTPGDVIGNKYDSARNTAGVATIMNLLRYIISSGIGIQAIFNLVNAILTLTETGGTVTTSGPGTQDDIYRVETPMGVFKPICVKIDTTNMAAADNITIRVYERIVAGGHLHLSDEVPFAAVQAIPIKTISLDPNRFGVQVTIEETAGAHRSYDWSVCYEV
jgi:hypothetical protein